MTVPLRVAERYRTLLEVNEAAITQPVPEGVFRGIQESNALRPRGADAL